MTLRGRLAALFPLVHLGLIAFGPIQAIRLSNPWWLTWGLFFLYLFPPLCHRLLELLWPLQEGWSNLSQPCYSPWWSSLQVQAVLRSILTCGGIADQLA